MLIWLLGMSITAAGIVDDVPPGTDVVLRVEAGKLSTEVKAAVADLKPVLSTSPTLERLVSGLGASWGQLLDLLESQTGSDVDVRRSEVTFCFDLDATGGVTWAAMIRNAMVGSPKAEPSEGVEPFAVDGHPAFRVVSRDFAWSTIGKTIVLGNERGMQRQVRHVQGGSPREEPIHKTAARLRKRAPLLVAFALPERLRRQMTNGLPNVGPLVGAVRSGHMLARPGILELRLEADNREGRAAIEHGVNAFVALLQAGVALLEGGTQAVLGLEKLGERPAALPKSLDPETMERLSRNWLAGFVVQREVRTRQDHAVDVTLEVSSFRGVLAALALASVMALPSMDVAVHSEAEALLRSLRRAQMVHKEKGGTYVTCGPVPAIMPVKPVDWPTGSCFDELEFAPPVKVSFQLLAGVEGGKLVLIARGDTNGDGSPETWVLDEDSPTIRPLGGIPLSGKPSP